MRPGRLDRILYVGPPDLPTRKDIFRIRLSKMATVDVDVNELARLASLALDTANGQTDGCSGAEVAFICQDAAISAMNEDVNVQAVSGCLLLR